MLHGHQRDCIRVCLLQTAWVIEGNAGIIIFLLYSFSVPTQVPGTSYGQFVACIPYFMPGNQSLCAIP